MELIKKISDARLDKKEIANIYYALEKTIKGEMEVACCVFLEKGHDEPFWIIPIKSRRVVLMGTLQEVISGLGMDGEVIDYVPDKEGDDG